MRGFAHIPLASEGGPLEALEPRKKPRQQRSRVTVDAILGAAARVLIDEGYDRASTNHIATVAGVSVGSLYQYFPSKSAIILELARLHADQQLVAIGGVLSAENQGFDIESLVRTSIQAMIRAHQIDPELHLVLTAQLLAAGLTPIREIQDRAVAMVRATLERHREQIRPSDLDTAAWLIVTCVEATVHGALIDQRDLDDPAIERELTDLVLRYVKLP